ncbi:hypothetical protein B0H16DRAFT_1729224 [Mycena metata]|uniref:RING-type domain-containing protein n=1 Tax=Mycena metata TaxID=1033252 RepID=A0AAD7MZG0_9AGAR|nr:hypothetical protein B0H16DRAFT_1729224 [Mycena metata]
MAHHLRILANKIDNHTINQNAAKDAVMESTQCPICYLPMFVPDTLPECGHTFCQSCLVGWFVACECIQLSHVQEGSEVPTLP